MFRFSLALLASIVSLALLLVPGLSKTPGPAAEVFTLKNPTLARDSFRRQAKELTLRLRNTNCSGAISLGSAFPLQDDLVVTNRHVVDGAAEIELNTWDGQAITLEKQSITIARGIDLAFISLEKPLNSLRPEAQASRNMKVTAVGYPKGKGVRLLPGKVKGLVSGKKLLGEGYRGRIIVTSSRVRQGNSGGPLLTNDGEMVGVIFAAGLLRGKTVESYAIPIEEALLLAEDERRTRPAPSCPS